MHITLESDYAIRIILCLARRGRRTDAGTIAEITGVSLRFALKILRNLVGSGMVRSFKGIPGGYELNHDPADITLKDILEVVEGEYHLSRCLGGECCNRPDKDDAACKVQKVFGDISRTVQEKLDAVTIAQLL